MDRPKLRKVDRIRMDRGGADLVVLRDPLGLCEPVAFDAQFVEVLDLLDGTRTLAQIRQSLMLRGVLDLPEPDLRDLVVELGREGLLDDDGFRARWAQAHESFLSAKERAPTAAGLLYPEDAPSVRQLLARTLPDTSARIDGSSALCGLLVPHAPFELAEPVLDATLRELPSADALDVVVVLGTDHQGGLTPYVITDKGYRTPLGSVSTSRDLVAAIDRRIEWSRREEIRHREASSIELAVLLLQHVYGSGCPSILPVLCGRTSLDPKHAEATDTFIATIEGLCEGLGVLFLATGELSHVGPAYGGPDLDEAAMETMRARDQGHIERVGMGSPDRLARSFTDDDPLSRPSGAAAITTLCRLLPVGYRVELGGYTAATVPEGPDGRMGLAGLRFYPALEG